MYCSNCGAKMEAGERFCSSCGTKTENVQPGGQQVPPLIPPAPPAYGQAGGQPPYPPAPPAYGQAGGQPPYPPAPPSYDRTGGKPPRKKPGKGLWIGIGAGVLAVILILVLFVYPGVLVSKRGPLSGNTVQTRFVNDSVAVFTDAFSGLDDTAVSKMMSQPFEMSADIDVDTGYGKNSASVDMAYDGLAFGLEAESDGATNTLLLLEDVLYVTSYGGVEGIEFDTADADLSESMTLSERLRALGGSEADGSDVDWVKLAEMLVNSIDKDCFEKGASETTLSMDSGDIADMLKLFSEKLEADGKLLDALESYIKDMTGEKVDVLDMIDEVSALVKAADMSLEWVVSYENGKPVSVEITIEAGGEKITASFGYERSGSAVDIAFVIKLPDGTKIKGSFSYERTAEGLVFSGEIDANGQKISFEGNAAIAKDKISGTIEVTASGQTMTIDYDGTLTFGKPKKDVEGMFDIDTKGVDPQKFSDLLALLSNNFSNFNSDYINDYVPDDDDDWDEPAQSSATAETSASADAAYSLDGTFWISPGYYTSDGLYYTGVSMYFYNGMVYFGDEECTPQDCLDYNLSPYDVHYTYDGYTVTLSAEGTSQTQELTMLDAYTMMGSDGTYFYLQ